MIDAGQIDNLINASKTAMENAYAPYSKFKVGAAVIFESGVIHSGCNVENASYGLSTCAERVAVFRAICFGERTLRAVAIASSSGETAYPCGACRQVLAEFAEEDETVFLYLVSKKGVEVYTLDELLPNAFKL